MKKRIYKINNKNLVTGNPNEVTENEILVKENNDGTVELSHRNNGTLETLGSGGNEPKNILDIPNITFTVEPNAFKATNVTKELSSYDFFNVDAINTIFQGNQVLFKKVDEFDFGIQKSVTFAYFGLGGFMTAEIMIIYENEVIKGILTIVGFTEDIPM